jgi:hypothetical protein
MTFGQGDTVFRQGNATVSHYKTISRQFNTTFYKAVFRNVEILIRKDGVHVRHIKTSIRHFNTRFWHDNMTFWNNSKCLDKSALHEAARAFHIYLSVAFYGSRLSNLLILIWLPILRATKAKNSKTFKHLLLN